MSSLPAILRDIKLSHSVFALPFAVIGLLVGTEGQAPGLPLVLAVVAAMVLARSAAMAFNRLVDHRFDATNPRTQGRALPAGQVSRRAMTVFLVLCSAGFIAVAAMLSPACGWLAPYSLAAFWARYSCSRAWPTIRCSATS